MRRFWMIWVMMGMLLFTAFGCTMVTTPAINATPLREVDFTKQLKRGESCTLFVLGFPVEGETSVVSAAKNGGIRKVEVVDVQYKNYILVAKQCVIVYGS